MSKIDPGNETAIETLVNIIENTQDEGACLQAAKSLAEIDPANKKAIQALMDIIGNWGVIKDLGDNGTKAIERIIQALAPVIAPTQDDSHREAVRQGIERTIQALVQNLVRALQFNNVRIKLSILRDLVFLDNSWNRIPSEISRLYYQEPLNLSDYQSSKLSRLFHCEYLDLSDHQFFSGAETIPKRYSHYVAVETLRKIGKGHEEAIQILIRVMNTTISKLFCTVVADSLCRIDPGNEMAIQALVRIINTTTNEFIYKTAVSSLSQIGSDNQTATQVVRGLRRLSIKETRSLMMTYAEALPYPKFYQAFHSPL